MPNLQQSPPFQTPGQQDMPMPMARPLPPMSPKMAQMPSQAMSPDALKRMAMMKLLGGAGR
jgi:hypothetical protein